MAAKKKTASKPSGGSRKTSAKPGKPKPAKAKAAAARPAKPAAKASGKPTGKPAAKPVTRPAPKSAGSSPSRPAGKPAAAGSARPGAKPVATVAAKPESRPASPPKPAGKGDGRDATFRQLRAILVPYAKKLSLKRDLPDVYYLDAAYSEEWKRDVFFGAVRTTESYVSFHLMPVYVFPELLKGMSPELKKRMQGKSCFNFQSPEKALFAELERLTAAGYDLFRKAGLA